MPTPPQSPMTLTGGGRRPAALFDLPVERVAAVAGAVRRLAHQPLSLRWLPTADEECGRALVRVESPPELLVERVAKVGHVFNEIRTDTWVEVGSWIPPADLPDPPAGHLLLVRLDGSEIIPPGPFVPEVEALTVSAPVRRSAGRQPSRGAVRLRLVPVATSGPPSLWVLRAEALAHLTAYCRVTHQQLLSRFNVAASASAGVACVVLWARTAKGPPPVFVGSAVAYAPTLLLPNLFLPAGMRLAPRLRRDALRGAVAAHPERVTWLQPLGDGGFRVESLPASAFQPLADWVDYRVPPVAAPGRPWVQSHRWDLEPFVEVAPQSGRRPPSVAAAPVAESADAPGFRSRAVGWLRGWRRRGPRVSDWAESAPGADEATRPTASDRLHHVRPETGHQAMERCQTLEAQILQTLSAEASEIPPARWAELAAAYDAAGNPADAAVCWLNALWGQPQPSPLLAWGWLRAEARAARPEVRVIDPAPWLAASPGPGTTRAMAAWVVWASLQSPTPSALADRGPELQARLEAHEHWLPVRAAWLAWSALARVGRGDVLGLARTRDRLAERLFADGLSIELDTPSFLRFAGDGARERFQEARRWLADRRDPIHQWLARRPDDAWVRGDPADGPGPLRDVGLEPDVAHTRAYADLVLAWGLARFAEHTSADQFRRRAAAALPPDQPVHALLGAAFEFRLTQVREGKPPHGPLPAELRARIERLTGLPRYAVDKLREHSRILEPTAHVTGYATIVAGTLSSRRATMSVEGLLEELDRANNARRDRSSLAPATVACLERLAELAEPAVDRVLATVLPAVDAADGQPRTQARLLALAMDAAGRRDRTDVVRDLTGRFLRLTDAVPGWAVVEALTSPAVTALRRVGLSAHAERVLDHVAHRVHRGQPLARARADRSEEWPAGLRVLLRAAAGWYAAGRDEPAHAVLDEARRDLFAPETTVADRTALAFAYADALRHAPVRMALGRLEELFQRLAGIQVVGTTNAYYALKPLLLVEAAVRAVVSDEFALGPPVRAWVNADELAVRRRIRDDLTTVLAAQGL